MSLTLAEINLGLEKAFTRFSRSYALRGGHRFHGFQGYGDPRNYQGPMLWSEGDCQFRLALELECEFKGMTRTPVARRHSPG